MWSFDDAAESDDYDIGFCSGCGADMRGEPAAESRCSHCAASTVD